MGAAGDPVAERVARIAADRTSGAGALARAAVETLALAAVTLPRRRGRVAYLRGVARALERAQPAMGAVAGAVRAYLAALQRHGEGPEAAEGARREVLRRMEEASAGAARTAAALVRDGDTVATCSFSSAVLRALGLAAGRGRVRVVALASVWDGVAHGERMAAALREAGVPVEVAPDGEARRVALRVALVLVGADRVLATGDLVNGWPTLRLLRAAHGRIPTYSVWEGFKLDRRRRAPRAPGFERVPGALVTAYATERGLVRPAELAAGTVAPWWPGGG